MLFGGSVDGLVFCCYDVFLELRIGLWFFGGLEGIFLGGFKSF